MKRVSSILLAMCLLMGCVFTGCSEESEKEDKNTYETPLDIWFEYYNAKKMSEEMENSVSLLNGFAEKEVEEVYEILKKADSYQEAMDWRAENYENETVAEYKEEYGNNYKFSYKIEEKDKLDDDALEEFRIRLTDKAEMLKNTVDKLENYSSSDWDEEIYVRELSESEREDLIKALKALYDVLKDAEVTEGYNLAYTRITEGSKLDEAEEYETSLNVFLVNGRWIAQNAYLSIENIIEILYYG